MRFLWSNQLIFILTVSVYFVIKFVSFSFSKLIIICSQPHNLCLAHTLSLLILSFIYWNKFMFDILVDRRKKVVIYLYKFRRVDRIISFYMRRHVFIQRNIMLNFAINYSRKKSLHTWNIYLKALLSSSNKSMADLLLDGWEKWSFENFKKNIHIKLYVYISSSWKLENFLIEILWIY